MPPKKAKANPQASSRVVRIIGREPDTGFLIAVDNDGEAFYLTDCCEARAKGCDGYVGCRACYGRIDPGLGDLPPAEWWAPHQRHRVESFNDFLIELVAKSLGRKTPVPPIKLSDKCPKCSSGTATVIHPSDYACDQPAVTR